MTSFFPKGYHFPPPLPPDPRMSCVSPPPNRPGTY